MAANTNTRSTRYVALDAFRGLTIALMILVNTPGSWSSVYAPLLHADWHGATPTDLIFPFFLFIIGSSLYFSFAKTNFKYSGTAVLKILRRTVIIFSLGLLLNAYGHSGSLDELRLMGVLQRLGIAYGIAAILVLFLDVRQLIVLAVGILAGYWLLLVYQVENPYSLNGNVVQEFDLWLLGASHLWQGKGVPFDPEGVLSTIPAVVNVLIGFEATRQLSQTPDKEHGLVKLITTAVAMMVFSLVWSLALPINKSLWTSSYVLFSSGCALLMLAFFIWLVDIKQQLRVVDPLLVYGTNPMFIYVLSWLWVTTYYFINITGVDGEKSNLYQYSYLLLADVMSPTLGSFIFAVIHVGLFWSISKFLYNKNIVIKV